MSNRLDDDFAHRPTLTSIAGQMMTAAWFKRELPRTRTTPRERIEAARRRALVALGVLSALLAAVAVPLTRQRRPSALAPPALTPAIPAAGVALTPRLLTSPAFAPARG